MATTNDVRKPDACVFVVTTQGRRKGFGGGAAPACAAWSRGIDFLEDCWYLRIF